MEKDKKLGLGLLVALGVGSMIGGGIFNSPTDLIGSANPQAVILAWGIGGIGVIFLALVFQLLANNRPELKGGIFTYAKDGFGDFTGFSSAWGYWLSAWLGNVAFIILIFKTLNSLTGTSNPVLTFVLASVFLWVMHFIQTIGSRNAGVLNAIATVAKIVPLVLVIIVALAVFSTGTFSVPNWKTVLASTGDTTTLYDQVTGAMSTILWCFIGVEAATVLSERAKSQKAVGTATVLSLLITLALYMFVSVSAMGVVPAKTLAEADTPLALVFVGTPIGSVGAVIVKLGLIISLVGGLISWIMLAAEIPYVAAKGGTMPMWFAKENKNGVPVNALLLTDVLTQLFLLAILLPALQTAYSNTFTISTTCILIPYLFSALYALKVCVKDKLSAGKFVISILATIYALYVIWAVGIKYVGEAFILYTLGLYVFYKAKKDKNESISSTEKVFMVLIGVIGVVMAILLATGVISL